MVDYHSQNGSISSPDAVFAALADATRFKIIKRLAEGDATVNELAQPFGMTLQAVSKHIRVLESAGLVTRQKIGRSYHCAFNQNAVRSARVALEEIESAWRARLDRLSDFLEQSP